MENRIKETPIEEQAYQKLKDIASLFEAGIDIGYFVQKTKKLDDGTFIVSSEYLSNPIQGFNPNFIVTVVSEKQNGTIIGQGQATHVEFQIGEDGLWGVKFPVTMKSELIKPRFIWLNKDFKFTPESKKGSKAFVDWLEKIVKADKYSSPPISAVVHL